MKLTPTQDLLLGVLAARYRCGELLWTFESRHKKTIRELAQLGLVMEASGVTENTVRAALTDAGRAIYLIDTYEIPNPELRIIDKVRAIVRTYEDFFDYQPEDGWRLQRDLMAALGMKRLEDEQ
jgi:hypothetical protein